MNATQRRTESVPGRKPVSGLMVRLLLAVALPMPALRTRGGVVFTSLHSFTGGDDGSLPSGGLVQGCDGNFYGTTGGGGTNNSGTVFRISTNGVLTSLYSFGSVLDVNGIPLDGADPTAGLVQGSDGNFYGTTSGGGRYCNGTVFRISGDGALTSLYSFGSVLDANGI
jgi:uncharacterized repeat protein (TIGR03803 family)